MTHKIVQLHDRITITLSPEASRLIREEIEERNEMTERWERTRLKNQDESEALYREAGLEPPARKPLEKKPEATPLEIVEEAIRLMYGHKELFRTACR